ncbi:MAG: GAF domain-containing protein [Anaerolineae bacterium]|nr:GAF domain-containing protein [Anaerolineae bacterium]
MSWNRWLAPLRRLVTLRYHYDDPIEARRARFLIWFSSVLLALALVGMASVSVPDILPDWDVWLGVVLSRAVYIVPILGGIYLLAQTGRWHIASVSLIAVLFVFSVLFVRSSGLDRSSVLMYSLVVLLASSLLGVGGLAASVLAVLASIVVIHLLQRAGLFISSTYEYDPILFGALILFADGMILWYFLYDRDVSLRDAQQAGRRLRVAALVSQTAMSTLDLATMLDQVVDQIRGEFALYHVQVFLIDEAGEYAVLHASTGEAGQRLLDRGHRLAVGSRSVIGQVTVTGEPVLAADTDVDEVHRKNEFLPDTRTELAVPVRRGERVIGALDLQSRKPYAFGEQDIEVFLVMANQLAAAIENARLFTGQAQRAVESEVLLRETETNLREIERLNRQLTRRAWSEYLQARGQGVVGITFQENRPGVDTVWTPMMLRAAREAQPTADIEGERLIVAVPVVLRNTVIGAIEVEGEVGLHDDDALEVAQAVADRLAVTVENVRLVERSQRLADREFQVSEVAAALQQQTAVDEMLSTAVSELVRLLGADRASIRLGLRQAEGAER